ncbi:MAG: Ig-like domain-containing protein [Deltaproteobacteria bacterium]|nr:Ig-like domain-containing protein [Deltaproteobacteria bacterium]
MPQNLKIFFLGLCFFILMTGANQVGGGGCVGDTSDGSDATTSDTSTTGTSGSSGAGGGTTTATGVRTALVSSASPGNSDTQKPINGGIAITFNTAMDSTSFAAGDLTVVSNNTSYTPTAVSYNSTNRTATWTVTVPGASTVSTTLPADSVSDASGNTNGEYTYSYSTDSTVPTFAGATTGTDAGSCKMNVSWSAATDSVTSASNMAYKIYCAGTGTNCDVLQASDRTTILATTPATVTGATSGASGTISFTQHDVTKCCIVRACDEANNCDTNTSAVQLGLVVTGC